MAFRVGMVALGVYLLALLSVLIVGPGSAPSAEPAPIVRTERHALPQLVGMTINLYHSEELPRYYQAIDQIADMGFNSLQIVTPIFQENGASSEVQVLRGPERGPERATLVSLLRYAKSKGLHTTLMPQIDLLKPRGNEWRGKIQPDDWGQWWQSYEQAIRQFLAIAHEAEVDVFSVGSELLTTQKEEHLTQWGRIIELARTQYTGVLIYSTNWDSYQKVPFWDQLDAIGISSYWNLTTLAKDGENPAMDELDKRWQQIRDQVLTFAGSQQRPVLFTELGYPSLPWGLRDPWNYVNSKDVAADPDTQARGYASFLTSWTDQLAPPAAPQGTATLKVQTPQAIWALPDPLVAGVLFYRWDPYHDGGPDDTGYGIRGKPTYDLLARWLVGELTPTRKNSDEPLP